MHRESLAKLLSHLTVKLQDASQEEVEQADCSHLLDDGIKKDEITQDASPGTSLIAASVQHSVPSVAPVQTTTAEQAKIKNSKEDILMRLRASFPAPPNSYLEEQERNAAEKASLNNARSSMQRKPDVLQTC